MSAAPLFGALLIGATYAVGSRYGVRVGLASAAIVASTPVFLSQIVRPTSDVPAAALWLIAVAGVTAARSRRAVLGGIAAAAAIVMRPLLAPLVLPLALFLVLRPERLWRERIGAAVSFAAAAAAGLVSVASIDTFFNAQHVAPNAIRFATWLSDALTPGWVLAAAAPFLLPGALTRLFLGMFLVNVACYLPSAVSDDWSDLRVLLPTIPLVVVLAIAVIDSLCRRTWSWTSRPVLAAVTAAMVVIGIRRGAP